MRRLDSLTSVRFFAALAVFAWHLQGVIASSAGGRAIRPGPLGVSFFFVLSGFVLAWSHRDGQPPRAFWRNRLARVYPNHIVAVLATVLLLFAQHARPGKVALALQVPLLQAWVPRPSIYFGVLSVDWSLSCELLFYATFPLLIGLVRRYGWLLVGPLLCFAAVLDLVALVTRPDAPPSSLVHLDFWVYIFPITRLSEFALGIMASLMAQRGTRRISVAAASLSMLVGMLIVTQLPTPVDLAALVAPLFALLIVALAQRDMAGARSWLAHPWLVRLGEWSFAFYLVHTIVLRLLLHEGAPRALVVVGGLLGSVVAAAALHHVVERPCERRIRKSGDRLAAVA